MRVVPILIAALAATAALAGEPSPDPFRPTPGEELLATIALELSSSMHATVKDAPVRKLSDAATIDARLRWRVGERDARGVRRLTGTPEYLAIRRRFELDANGFFSKDQRDELGQLAWRAGDRGPPPPAWTVDVDARGAVQPGGREALAVAAPALSRQESCAALRWFLDPWLHPLDADQPPDAQLRRTGRLLELGPGFLGAPLSPDVDAKILESVAAFEVGESSLTNALLVAVTHHALERIEGGERPRFRGKLARLDVEGAHGGNDRGKRRPDRWLELARDEGVLATAARGELEARLDPRRGLFDEVRSTLWVEVHSRYGEKGSQFPAVARLGRKLVVKLEPVKGR